MQVRKVSSIVNAGAESDSCACRCVHAAEHAHSGIKLDPAIPTDHGDEDNEHKAQQASRAHVHKCFRSLLAAENAGERVFFFVFKRHSFKVDITSSQARKTVSGIRMRMSAHKATADR